MIGTVSSLLFASSKVSHPPSPQEHHVQIAVPLEEQVNLAKVVKKYCTVLDRPCDVVKTDGRGMQDNGITVLEVIATYR